jgi:long-chain acyl-CoA synthetase
MVNFKSTQQSGFPPATIFFFEPTHLEAVVGAIVSIANKSFLFPLSWRCKLSAMLEGYIAKGSLWDRFMFGNARNTVLGEGAPSLRAVVVNGGGVPVNKLTLARIALSIPLVIAHTHPVFSAPVLASHDMQTFAVPSKEEFAHVGEPVNLYRTQTRWCGQRAVESGVDPEGVQHVRGSIVGRVLL